MAKRDSKITVDLFPFLSVLCCMIGVLMLYIVAILSTRVIEAEDAIQRGRASAGTAGPGEDEVDEETYTQLSQQIDALEQTVLDRQRARFELQSRIEQLQALIEIKQDELAAQKVLARREPIRLDEPDPVRPVLDTSGFTIAARPITLEVTAEGYLLPDGTFYSAVKLEEQKQKTKETVPPEKKAVVSKELVDFLRKIDADGNKFYLVLFLHPNGTESLSNLRYWLRTDFPNAAKDDSRIQLGVEPFSRESKLIMSQDVDASN